jgi:hypothetical protein
MDAGSVPAQLPGCPGRRLRRCGFLLRSGRAYLKEAGTGGVNNIRFYEDEQARLTRFLSLRTEEEA